MTWNSSALWELFCDAIDVPSALTPDVVEVGGDGNNGVGDLLDQVGLGGLRHLL